MASILTGKVLRAGPLVAREVAAEVRSAAEVTPRAELDAFVEAGPSQASGLATLAESRPALFGTEPSAYVATFDVRQRSALARLDGAGDAAISMGTQQTPSFTAQAGKPLIVTVNPERFLRPNLQEVALSWYFDSATPQRQVISTGARDEKGFLQTVPGRIDVPADASGTMRLRIETTDAKGTVTTHWDPTNDVRVGSSNASTVVFADDGSVRTEAPIRPGDTLKLAYDQNRLRSQLGIGENPTKVIASVRFNKGLIEEYPLLVNGQKVLPSVAVPFSTTALEVWFRAERAAGETVWDSRNGENHPLPVGVARDDADPSWKKMMLKSTNFPKLTADSFVGIGPNNGSYNCIAWTVGERSKWVWPGTTVKAFDELYAKNGFTALETFDASLDPALEKIAIYATTLKSGLEVQHGARQEPNGQWTSKIGANQLIRHQTLESIAGGGYGEPIRIYTRPRVST